MADKRAYFKLDVGYLTNPKVALLAIERPSAVLLHIASIAYSAQHLTDGLVPVALLLRLNGAAQKDADALFGAGLWHDLDDGKAEIHDYLEHQRSAAEAKQATDKAMRAAGARWNASSNASSMPDAKRSASASPMPREKRERDINDGAFDAFWAAYPKKVGKGQAVKAWNAATKRADAADIVAGLTASCAAWKSAGTEARFIPNPATWLNGERWADETAPEPTADEWIAPPPQDWEAIRAAAQAEKAGRA